jgi:aminocarboxymuconate-semialdehyde decarboxylase
MSYDVHAHVVPQQLLDALARNDGRSGVTLTRQGGTARISVAGGAAGPVRDDMLDVGARLAAMDRAGVDVQLLSAWIGLTGYGLPVEHAVPWTRMFNEALAETVGEHPDRFLGLCLVPLQAPVEAADELRHAVRRLGMVGVEIATTIHGKELDDPGLEPFWQAAEELRCFVLIHPDQVLPGRREVRYVLNNFVGNAAESTIAAAHLVFGGVLERHPDLRVCLVHGGGYAPYQAGRMDHGYVAEPRLVDKRLSLLPSDYLRRLYYDTVTHSPAVLRFLLDFAGAEHVVLGSDYPFEMGEADPVESLRRVPDLQEPERRLIEEGNLQRLLADVRHDEAGRPRATPTGPAPRSTDG